jgi:CubicO group peptidase (beta-lactamase class C family)
MSISSSFAKNKIEELRHFIEEIINSREDTIGLSIALTTDKELIWAEGFGFTNHTETERATAETLFSSQSVGKTFTASAFLILASRGLISLDDPIRKYYPEFNINTIHGNLDEEISKITFRRMLSHTAGLTHEALRGNNCDYSPCTFEEHIKSINDWWLKLPVGTEMSYSNLGYDLTAYVMGLIKDTSFEKVMKEELFDPLEMSTTTLDIKEAMKNSFAKGYEGISPFPVVQIPMLGAGGYFFNVLDVAKFIRFHLRKGRIGQKQIINPNLFEEMYRTTSNQKSEYGYGLGIYSAGKIANSLIYGHAGGGYGYQTNMMWIPEKKIGVVVLSNNMKDSRVNSIAMKALKLMIGESDEQEIKKEFKEPKCEEIPAELLENLEGTYCAENNLTSQMFRIAYESNTLLLYDMSNKCSKLYPINSTDFTTDRNRILKFELNHLGRPTGVFVDDLLFPYRYKYNDGPNDEEGPNLEEWKEYLGTYFFEDENKPSSLLLRIENGFLYLNYKCNLKLIHYKENIFFTPDGEAIIIDQNSIIYKGIKATRKEEIK